MIPLRLALMTALAIGTLCHAEERGVCPPLPPPNANLSKKATPSARTVSHVATVTLLLVVSDKGYVCDSRVLRGVSAELDRKARAALQEWHFDPAEKDGRAVPVVITVDVDFKTNDAGEIVPVLPPTKLPAGR